MRDGDRDLDERGDAASASDDAALLALAAWTSAAYPVGAFAYSHGLETAVASGAVSSAAETLGWTRGCLANGAFRSDAILLSAAWRAARASDEAALAGLAELGRALAASAERRVESDAQGAAFTRIAAVVEPAVRPRSAPTPVALGAAAGEIGAPLRPTLLLFLQGAATALIGAAVRLVPLGQTEGQGVLAALRPTIAAVAREAETGDLDRLGGAAFLSDIAAMRHETLETRLFKT